MEWKRELNPSEHIIIKNVEKLLPLFTVARNMLEYATKDLRGIYLEIPEDVWIDVYTNEGCKSGHCEDCEIVFVNCYEEPHAYIGFHRQDFDLYDETYPFKLSEFENAIFQGCIR